MTDIKLPTPGEIKSDLWEHLAGSDKPIVMYGMGNGADKILRVFEKYSITVSDFFASDGFVRGQQFHGKTVCSYSDICKKYDDFIIVVSFGTRLPEVLGRIYDLAEVRELYLPDVPVAGDNIFTREYYSENYGDFSKIFGLLADDKSRETLRDVINYRLTGDILHLKGHTVSQSGVFSDILHSENIRNCADLGAYTGDSIASLARYAPNLSQVIAMEPDAKNFKKLSAFAENTPYKVRAYNLAAWDREEELEFSAEGNRNSSIIAGGNSTSAPIQGKVRKVRCADLDSLQPDLCDYIKYDVEGAEYEAILGSRTTIEKFSPKLLVSLYHRTEDIIRLTKQVASLGYSKLYIRRFDYIPAWDLNLLAIK